MSWWGFVPTALVAVAWLMLPGLAIGYALGLRSVTLAGLAPVGSVAVLAVTAVLLPKIRVPWNPVTAAVPVVVLTAVIALVAWLLRHRYAVRGKPDPRSVSIGAAIGLVAAAVLGVAVLVAGFAAPDNLSQTYDAVFHYNGITAIVDSHNASPTEVSASLGSSGFYPVAFHDMVSLVAMTTQASVPVAVNATVVALGAFAWPLGCLVLARQVFGNRVAALVATGVVSGAFGAFPWGLFDYGVLWPNALGLILVPAGLAAVCSLLGIAGHGTISSHSVATQRFSSQRVSSTISAPTISAQRVSSHSAAEQDAIGRPRAVLVLLAVLVGSGLAQPNAVFSLAALALVPITFCLVSWAWREHKGKHTPRAVVAIIAYPVVLVGLYKLVDSLPQIKTVKAFDWPAFQGRRDAIIDVATNATNLRVPQYVLGGLIVVGGVIALLRPGLRWLPFAHLVTAFLFVLDASQDTPLSTQLTGFWYNDSQRLAAMLPITGVILAALAVTAIADWLFAMSSNWVSGRRFGDGWLGRALKSPVTVPAVLLVVLVAVTGGMYQGHNADEIHVRYVDDALSPNTSLVDPAERAFFAKVGQVVPAGSVIANDPWDGSALLWTLTDRKVLFPHLAVSDTATLDYLARHLDDAATDPRVCRLASQANVRYLVVAHDQFWTTDPRQANYPGLRDPGNRAGFTKLIDDNDGLRLYRISACDRSG